MPEAVNNIGVLNQKVITIERDIETIISRLDKNDEEHAKMKDKQNETHSDVREIKVILTQMHKDNQETNKKLDKLAATSDKVQDWRSIITTILQTGLAIGGGLAVLAGILKTLGWF